MARWEPISIPGDVHVMPNYGREHDSSSACWCQPALDSTGGARVWIHRVPQ